MYRNKLSKPGDHSSASYSLTADFFRFFSNPTTLLILENVRKKRMSARAISKNIGIAAGKVQIKLTAMEQEGVLISQIRSGESVYRVADSKIAETLEQILDFPQKKLK